MVRVGVIGGTFDPIHRAHVELPLALAAELEWDRIIFMPAWRQPFKEGATSPFHRFAMVVLATREIPQGSVSLLELERGSVSFTVDTLEGLSRAEPEVSFEWVIGEDNLEQLPRWKNTARLMELANFIVLRRGLQSPVPDELAPEVHRDRRSRPPNGAIVFADNVSMKISSTEIRERVGAGRSIEGLVHPEVMHYIKRTGLYQNVR